MIDAIIIVVLLLIVISPLLLYRKTDNRNWLELKENAEECLSRYSGDGDDYVRVEGLVTEFRFMCEEIAKCNSLWDAKRGQFYANHATEITRDLAKLGFFEKTQEVTE